MNTSNITITSSISQDKLEYVKAFLKALKIKFEITKEEAYNEEFVKKIKQGEQDFKNGNSTRIEKEDLSNFLGLE